MTLQNKPRIIALEEHCRDPASRELRLPNWQLLKQSLQYTGLSPQIFLGRLLGSFLWIRSILSLRASVK